MPGSFDREEVTNELGCSPHTGYVAPTDRDCQQYSAHSQGMNPPVGPGGRGRRCYKGAELRCLRLVVPFRQCL